MLRAIIALRSEIFRMLKVKTQKRQSAIPMQVVYIVRLITKELLRMETMFNQAKISKLLSVSIML